MKIRPEKPKEPRQSSSTSSEQAKLKEFLVDNSDVIEYLLAILEDAHQQLTHYRHADYLRDVATLRRRYESEGLSFATKTLPELFTNFLKFLETGKPSYPSFKTVRGGKHPVFLRQLFAMVSECHDDASCTTAMACLYQLCHAFKKFRGPYRTSTLQNQLWGFVEDDIELKYIDFFAEPLYPILCKARAMVKDLFEGFDLESDPDLFVPTPGSGATNTPTRKNVRYRPHVLYEQLDEVFPYEDWFFSNPGDLVTDPTLYNELRRDCAPTSRFKFVPKTYGKPRGICIEELETQYLQQALRRFFYARLETHPLTKGFVNFADQSVNGRLALVASNTREFATLDMSAASDRVSRTLVRYLFHDVPEIRKALMSTSTRTITLPENLIEFPTEFPCEKFAPMGSAVCFPIMALVHFVLIKAILTLSRVPQAKTREVYVYGDDIIVRSECVDAIYAYLPLFGMKFNTEKSYVHSNFRESCGMHAYKGVEITPEYFKYLPKCHSPRNVVLSLLSTEARLFAKGFRQTAVLLRRRLSKVKCLRGFELPFVTPKSPILGWIREDSDAPSCRHIGLKRRLDRSAHDQQRTTSLYRYEVRALVARPSQEETTIKADHEAYLRWFCDCANSKSRFSDEISWSYTGLQPTSGERFRSAQRFALADHARTTVDAKKVRDSQTEPPWIGFEWVPESAL